MIPDWMKKQDSYSPSRDGGRFITESLKSMGRAMSRISVQKGHEKGRPLPALVKFIGVICGIVILSAARGRMIVMLYAAAVLLYLCTWPAKDIAAVLKAAAFGGMLAAVLLIPAAVFDPAFAPNGLILVIKVFLSMLTISIFNHTTQWNHITGALRRLRIPGIFIFTVDITLKYIVLLGNLIADLLTALQLRSVGRNNNKYGSVGGIMGVTFIRGTEMNRQMYEAMQCRGFTDDYKGL